MFAYISMSILWFTFLIFFADKYTAPIESIKATAEDFFYCSNGDKISLEYLCDGIQDCVDFSDELNCLGTG
jgi:hypothetical protein